MPKVRSQKQQDITSMFRQEKKITSRYFKANESSTNDKTELPHRSSSLQKEKDMKKLKEFDLNWEYGPCTGITRLERWERAEKHDQNPPQDVRELIKIHQEDNDYIQSLWKDYDL